MVGGTIQVGEVTRCRAAGEEETGADEAEAGIVVVVVEVIDHTNPGCFMDEKQPSRRYLEPQTPDTSFR